MRKLSLLIILLCFSLLFLINSDISLASGELKDVSSINVSSVNITMSLSAFDFENREASCRVEVKIQVDEFYDKPIKVDIVSEDAIWLEIEPQSSKSRNKTYYIKSGILKSYFVMNGFCYPFDCIIPYLRIDLPFNMTKDKINVEYSINDADARYVYCEKGKLYLDVKNSSRGSTIEVRIELDRKIDWAFPIMIPLAIAYLILGVSAIMQRKDNASTHLTVYLSVLTIALTLFFSIKDTLPLRPTLSIAEILILALMASTSFFIICCMLNWNLVGASVASVILIFLIKYLLIRNYRFTETALNGYHAFSLLICVLLIIPFLLSLLGKSLKYFFKS